jgi:hypothetical protein
MAERLPPSEPGPALARVVERLQSLRHHHGGIESVLF